MNIQINNPLKCDIMLSIFQHIKLFSSNILIVFEKEKMYIQTMDPSHISIIEVNIPSTWFDKYENTQDKIMIGISSLILFKLLNTRDKSHNIEIVYAENNDEKLFVNFHSNDKTVFNKNFEIPLISLDYDIMDIPEIEHQAEITMSSFNFANLINDLKNFGDTMDIQCSDEKILLCAKSQDNGKMSVEINIDDLNSFIIDEGGKLNLSFSLKQLYNITQFHKISKEVELKMSNDYPIRIIQNLGGDNATLTFFLAPKISDL